MRVLVTGATGFVGAWTALALQEQGHHVRLLARDPSRLHDSAEAIGADCADVALGDMCDQQAVSSALEGCDALVHAAAVVALKQRDAEQRCAANVVGARTVLGAAVERGLARIVHVSSSSTLWSPRRDVVSPGQEPVDGSSAYARSKAAADRYARHLQRQGHPVAITYPCTILGPAAGSGSARPVRGSAPSSGSARSRDAAQRSPSSTCVMSPTPTPPS